MYVALVKFSRANEADVSCISLWVVIHWQSDLKAACLNVILDRALFTKPVHIASILFLEVHHLHRTWISMLIVTVVIFKAWYL